MNNCISTIPSLNISIKVQKELAKIGVFCKIISLDPSMSHRGCAYGIEYSCYNKQTVDLILHRLRVRSEFIQRDGS